MTTSYTNTGGRGDRRSIITVTTTATLSGGSPAISGLVDGLGGTAGSTNSGAPFWNNAQTLRTITFQFTSGNAIIDEVTYFQNGNAAHGTWRWRASMDGSSWTVISAANFTLDAPSVGAVVGDISANTTAWTYYQLEQVSGTTNDLPWLREYEFKINIVPAEADITAAPALGISEAAAINFEKDIAASPALGVSMAAAVGADKYVSASMDVGISEAASVLREDDNIAASFSLGITEVPQIASGRRRQPVVCVTT